MRQIRNPIDFLNENAALTPIDKWVLHKRIRKHQREYSGQPFVADLKSGLLIAETPIEIDFLSVWASGRTW
ncbi:MAG: hypothetical protein IJY32_00865 [Mogibacterium sp.]|nr:hypothetical protein [Mogibacterium sp.]